MMNKIFGSMLLIGLLVGILSGQGQAILDSMINGMGEAVTLSISLAGAFMFWMGIMEVARDLGVIEKLAKWTRPLLHRLFPKSGSAVAPITLNLAANFFGMGSAATPFGLEAMAELEKYNRNPGVATDDMCMFIALNASALELLPTGVIALRSAAGSANPYSIVVPKFLSSVISFAAAIIMCRRFSRFNSLRGARRVSGSDRG